MIGSLSTNNNKDQFDLNQPLKDHNGELIYIYDDIPFLPMFDKENPTELNEKIKNMSRVEKRKIAPKYTFGIAVKQILSSEMPPEHNNDLAERVFSYIQRINNSLKNNKGLMNLDHDSVQDFKKLLDESATKMKPIIIGQIMSILNLYDANLIVKNAKG